jgi:hypothetical protein
MHTVPRRYCINAYRKVEYTPHTVMYSIQYVTVIKKMMINATILCFYVSIQLCTTICFLVFLFFNNNLNYNIHVARMHTCIIYISYVHIYVCTCTIYIHVISVHTFSTKTLTQKTTKNYSNYSMHTLRVYMSCTPVGCSINNFF